MPESKFSHVTDEQFRLAQENKDNQNIIKHCLRQYSHQIDSDTLHSLGLIALWKCIGYFKPGFQKFTTNLTRFVHFQCRNELRRLKRRRPTKSLDDVDSASLTYSDAEHGLAERDHMLSCLDQVGDENRQLIRQHFQENMDASEIAQANGYTKQTARQKLLNAVQNLREVARHALLEPV